MIIPDSNGEFRIRIHNETQLRAYPYTLNTGNHALDKPEQENTVPLH
jgi:hypothetical protein